ncbi:hypothetical protein EDF68_1402 [Ochrobactrum sp. BH3]|uniref:hypothetical protein n=1 Tax=Brucella pituitosa TaxID=571256 RepID=UPI000C2802F6|nr:hypothetical protein [Brucella pituitosa]PJO48173.1 hypothetical protein CWE02_10730 [Brucella pituitosa]TCQ70236.1 hypothetical protein EDF68_1402 [Ochrobactrum sp. BH3]
MKSTRELHQQMLLNLTAQLAAIEKIAYTAIALLCKMNSPTVSNEAEYLRRLFNGISKSCDKSLNGTEVEKLAAWLRNREKEHLQRAFNEIQCLLSEPQTDKKINVDIKFVQ